MSSRNPMKASMPGLLNRLMPVLLLAGAVLCYSNIVAAAVSAPEKVAAQWSTIALPPASPDSVLKIPKNTLVMRNGIPGVFVVQDGQARFRMVRTGRFEKNQVHILSGLFGGETLVSGDVSSLYDGMALPLSQ